MFTIKSKEGAYGIKTIFIDDEPWKDVHQSIFGRQNFEIESAQQFDLLEEKKTLAFVYKKLAIRNYSSFELKKILKEYLVSPSVIESVIKKCQIAGYINDAAWLESFIRSAKAKKLGPNQILQKLLQKGLKREVIEEALAAEDLPEDRLKRIILLLKTRYKSKDLTIFQERQKVAASLARKGFSFEDIRAAFLSIEKK